MDVNESKIELYKNGIDSTNEVGNDVIENSNVYFTSQERTKKGVICSFIMTVNNILHGMIKKLVYKRHIDESDIDLL